MILKAVRVLHIPYSGRMNMKLQAVILLGLLVAAEPSPKKNKYRRKMELLSPSSSFTVSGLTGPRTSKGYGGI